MYDKKMRKSVMLNTKICNTLILICCTINTNFGLSNGARLSVKRQSDLNENTVNFSDNNEISFKTPEAKEFAELLNQCIKGTAEYNVCVTKALNRVAKYIPKGIPELNIPILDPITADEISLHRTSPIPFKIKLKNIFENGWKTIRFVSFESDANSKNIKFELAFGNKDTIAEYELETPILNINKVKGNLKLLMFGLNATAMISRLKDDSINVYVDIERLGDMKLFITIPGNPALENLANGLINSPLWRPGFAILKPYINELVSTGYTQYANTILDNYFFKTLLPPYSS